MINNDIAFDRNWQITMATISKDNPLFLGRCKKCVMRLRPITDREIVTEFMYVEECPHCKAYSGTKVWQLIATQEDRSGKTSKHQLERLIEKFKRDNYERYDKTAKREHAWRYTLKFIRWVRNFIKLRQLLR